MREKVNIPTAAIIGQMIDREFLERSRPFVNWLPYNHSASPDNIDLYVADVSRPTRLGVLQCQRFNHEHPEAHLLLLLDSDSAIRHFDLLNRTQCTGILLKSSPSSVVEQAITQVAAGVTFCDPDFNDILSVVASRDRPHKSISVQRHRSVLLQVKEIFEPIVGSAMAAATAKIRRAWFPPSVQSTTGAVVSFAIDEQFRPCQLTVIKPSKEDHFEKAALDALNRVQLTELPVNGSFTVSFSVQTKQKSSATFDPESET